MATPPSERDPEQLELAAEPDTPQPAPLNAWQRLRGVLDPAHRHSVFSATVVLMVSTFLSRIIGLVRVKYIVWLFGRGVEADALNAAFVLPDMISYFLVGGAASITFVTILTRYHEDGREVAGQRSLSVILTTMYLVLGGAIVLAEILAPWYVHWWFNGFDAHKAAMCVELTRILLPAQLCFFAGGVFGAVLLVRKQFNVQAVAPLIYGMGTIVGGLLLVKKIGVSSLAIGTVGGAFCGPFLLNWIFAHRAGTRYRFILDWHDEGLRDWVRLSLPLMAGVSLVTADNWIIAHFASHIGGAVSLMSYAKQVFSAPVSVLAQAAGAASLPFFASLWTRDRRYEFATNVADSVSRVASLSLLVASMMVALGWPAIDLVFTGGHFSADDARLCSSYFAVFSVSLFLWSAQAIYSRAFYAAGNTFVPMVASTIVTVVSLPIYYVLFQWRGAMGLALASDIGIALQTLTIALLLHKRRMVSLANLDYAEMGRCLLGALAAGAAAWLVAWCVAALFHHLPRLAELHRARSIADVAILIGGLAVWTAVAMWILDRAGSALPRVTLRRLRMG
ncbi:MAG TPA: murein biosynthesis integral membrane protein MurJ [Terracidiphilus sp.]|nr:murein biosynthesis integral membrane protein MurJ [Terracidiphilus sp.]